LFIGGKTLSFQDMLGRIYENFFMRDLTYIFSGFLILWSLRYSFENVDVFNYLFVYLKITDNHEWFKLIIVLFVSYFIGLIIKEALVNDRCFDSESGFCKWLKKSWFEDKWFSTNVRHELEALGYYKDRFLYYMGRVKENSDDDVVKELARVEYFMHIGASVGIGFLVSSAIFFVALLTMLINMILSLININLDLFCCDVVPKHCWCNYIIFSVFTIFISWVCYKENRWKLNQYVEFFNNLWENSV